MLQLVGAESWPQELLRLIFCKDIYNLDVASCNTWMLSLGYDDTWWSKIKAINYIRLTHCTSCKCSGALVNTDMKNNFVDNMYRHR